MSPKKKRHLNFNDNVMWFQKYTIFKRFLVLMNFLLELKFLLTFFDSIRYRRDFNIRTRFENSNEIPENFHEMSGISKIF